MVAQTTIIPRTVTATLSNATRYNQSAVRYNAGIAYNQPTQTNGSALPRTISSASMKAR